MVRQQTAIPSVGLLVASVGRTCKGRGDCGQKLKQIVDCSSSRGVAAELLAKAHENERLQGGVDSASHVALLGQRILCVIATRFAPAGWPGGPTACGQASAQAS